MEPDQVSAPTDETAILVVADDESPAAPPAADPAPLDDAEADEDAAPELSAEEWSAEAAKARKQAAAYRVKLRAAEQRLTELESAQAQPAAPDPVAAADARAAAAERRASVLEAAVERNIPAAALSAFQALAVADTDGIAAALDALAPFLAPRAAGVQKPPSSSTTPPTLDQQIADAERSRDVRLSIALKAQKASGR